MTLASIEDRSSYCVHRVWATPNHIAFTVRLPYIVNPAFSQLIALCPFQRRLWFAEAGRALFQEAAFTMLFHVSEESGIERFDPRFSEYTVEPVVWAIDADRLRNYLVPRECPRVTYCAGLLATSADRDQLLGSFRAVVAIEAGWLERVQQCRLHCYHLPSDTFECLDESAGYFVSRVSVTPALVEVFDDVVSELERRGVQCRVLPNLWPLRDAVVASSLQFSLIRMRNALPRSAA